LNDDRRGFFSSIGLVDFSDKSPWTSCPADGVVHHSLGFDRDPAFLLSVFATDFVATAFARARAALLAAARLSADHGVY